MKIKKIMMFALLLAVLTVGAVSAADDNAISDNLTVSEDSNAESPISNGYDEVLGTGEGTFSDLSTLIGNTASGSTLQLDKDYKNDGSQNTITISKSMTIDGKGHKIDGNSKSGIFNVEADNVVLKNIDFVNAAHKVFNAEEYNCTIQNCNFDGCSDFDQNKDESVDGGVISMGSGSIINCSFANCVRNVQNMICGGVIYIQNGDIINCSFDNCCYGGDLVYGGAIHGNGNVINCTFSYCGNKCNLIYGGAINFWGTVTDCTFSHCADNSLTVYGGAIEGEGRVINCSFFDCSVNSDEPYGGDVHFTGNGNISNSIFMSSSGVCCNYDCIGNVNNCTFIGCTLNAVSFWCKGGNVVGCTFRDCTGTAIYIDDYHKINIVECIFTNCSSNENGGAIYNCAHDFEFFEDIEEDPNEYENGTGAHVSDCTFVKCSAKEYGGAIYCQDKSEGSVSNCSFEECSAKYGGAVYVGEGAEVRITSSNFENNKAKYSGGAIVGGVIFDCTLDKNSKPEISSPSNYAEIVPVEVISDDDGFVTFRFPKDAEGTLEVFLNGTSIAVAQIVKGIAKIDLSQYKGSYMLTYEYSGDANYNAFIKDSNTTVIIIPAKIIAGDVKVLYTSGKRYTITVFEEKDVIAVNALVVVKLKNKSLKVPNTDAEGVTGFKITQAPGTYKLTISSLNKTVSKTLTVKSIVKLKSATVKKSAKKLVLTATLSKVNNNYLKNKKVTFKFNGKKYTAKTNKKGVAKYTIKSKVFKKLKVGKKVTYQATYLKDTAKRTAKVKK